MVSNSSEGVQEGRGTSGTLGNPHGSGNTESKPNAYRGEHECVGKVGLVPSGIEGPKGEQRLPGLGDVWAKGNLQMPPLCCDRTLNTHIQHLVYLDEFVHR